MALSRRDHLLAAVFVVSLALLGAVPAEAVSCAGVPAWNGNGVPYTVGTQVTYGGARYTCSVAHTSVYNWDPVNYAQGWGWGTPDYGAPCDAGATPTATSTSTAPPSATATATATPTTPPTATATATS